MCKDDNVNTYLAIHHRLPGKSVDEESLETYIIGQNKIDAYNAGLVETPVYEFEDHDYAVINSYNKEPSVLL